MSTGPDWWPEHALWNEWTCIYRLDEAGSPWRRRLTSAPPEAFTETLRRSLAAETELFFIKTHERPFAHYLEGERVVQIARHPGQVLASYARYLHQLAARKQPALSEAPTLQQVIEGEVQFGDWSDYHRTWLAAASALGQRHIMLDYATVAKDQDACRAALADFLDIRPINGEPISFEDYRRKHLDLQPRGLSSDYESLFQSEGLEMLWRRHGEVASELGFDPLKVGCAP